MELTAEHARELFDYDPETGALAYKNGTPAGWLDNCGYYRVSVKRRKYLTHRVVWLMATGGWPTGDLDHIDGDRRNNRIANLRDVHRNVNAQNVRRARRHNVSGVLGAELNSGSYMARVTINKTRVYVGRFPTPEEAHTAYLEAKRKLHEGCTI